LQENFLIVILETNTKRSKLVCSIVFNLKRS